MKNSATKEAKSKKTKPANRSHHITVLVFNHRRAPKADFLSSPSLRRKTTIAGFSIGRACTRYKWHDKSRSTLRKVSTNVRLLGCCAYQRNQGQKTLWKATSKTWHHAIGSDLKVAPLPLQCQLRNKKLSEALTLVENYIGHPRNGPRVSRSAKVGRGLSGQVNYTVFGRSMAATFCHWQRESAWSQRRASAEQRKLRGLWGRTWVIFCLVDRQMGHSNLECSMISINIGQ